jgi:hypothetical protein
MQGVHTFDLDAHYLSKDSRAFGLSLEVSYEVNVHWDKEAGSVGMGKAKPESVTVKVGGMVLEAFDYEHAHSALKSFVHLESEKLGLEQLGISDEEARDYLISQEDWRAHVREHAAGRV